MNRKGIAGPLLEYIQNMAHYLRVLHGNDSMQVIMLDIGDVLYTTQQLNYIVLKHVNWVHIVHHVYLLQKLTTLTVI